MHCTNYIPLFYHVRDLNGGSGGFSLPFLNGNDNGSGNCVEEKGHDLLLPSSMDHCVGYDKDAMRRIIQKHESTFRHQVQELHTLYRRQKELMNEMKPRPNFPQHLFLQASEPSYSLSRARLNLTQMTSHDMIWLRGFHSNGKFLEATRRNTPTYSLDENFREPIHLSSHSDEKRKRTLLDLGLPSRVCHDSEGKIFGGDLSYAARQHKGPATSDPLVNYSDTDSFKTGNSSCNRSEFLIDLNEPVRIEKVHSCSIGLSDHPECVVARKTGFVNSGGTSVNLNLPMAIDLNSMPIRCFSESETSHESLLQNRDTRASLDCSSARDHDHSLWKQKSGEEEYIDLNSVGKSSPEQPYSVVPITFAENPDLIFPVSPQNKEGSPPRGESEDIQPEIHSLSSEQRLMGIEIIAAQTLVMMSSSGMQEQPGNVGSSLLWFANIVASAADDAAKIDQSELLSDVMHDLPARTRKLSGKNPPYHPPTVKDDKEACPFTMPKKGPATGKRLCKKFALHPVDALNEQHTSKRNKRMRACSTEMFTYSIGLTPQHPRTRSKQTMVNSWGRTRKREGGCRRRKLGKFLN